MKPPEETEYIDGQKRLEDIHGWVYCPHCDKCAITNDYQLYTDGMFFCMFLQDWKEAMDILEYKCKGYTQKRCSSCIHRESCEYSGRRISYCDRYLRTQMKSKGKFLSGQRFLPSSMSLDGIENEDAYNKYKRRLMHGDEEKEVV